MDQERLSCLALHFVPGIGNHLVKQLIGYCGSAHAVFKTPAAKLRRIPGIGTITAGSIKAGNTFRYAERELRKAEKEEVQLLFFTDKAYPLRLKVIDDSPTLLYLKGNINLNPAKTVGIVGTRQATAYGKEIVERTVEDLARHEVLIVSGLAYGIDIHAHKQALKQQLPTVGVMGSGIDVVYPAVHRDIARRMADQGGLVTENHFGVQPDAHHFPARNRIIAGLCDALLVVEAAERGGALITAEIANSYNKDVFAAPGNIGAVYSAGCNKLIKTNKANLFTSVKDLEYIMNWTAGGVQGSASPAAYEVERFTPDEQTVLEHLHKRNAPVMIDELSLRCGIPPGLLASVLLSLEFSGIITVLPGKQYQLARR
jgi:DNA processing protein